jgi:hypothetical protein
MSPCKTRKNSERGPNLESPRNTPGVMAWPLGPNFGGGPAKARWRDPLRVPLGMLLGRYHTTGSGCCLVTVIGRAEAVLTTPPVASSAACRGGWLQRQAGGTRGNPLVEPPCQCHISSPGPTSAGLPLSGLGDALRRRRRNCRAASRWAACLAVRVAGSSPAS